MLELPFVLGLIVLPFAVLVLQLPTWVEHQLAATDAAAEVARAVTVSESNVEVGDLVAAIEASHGLAPGSLRVRQVDGRPGEPVTARVTVDVPALTVPGFGVVARHPWTATHVERRPDFASVEP
ncbi:MAG: hypothetical protein R2710_27390 [Acidimicrobiales bacterium]